MGIANLAGAKISLHLRCDAFDYGGFSCGGKFLTNHRGREAEAITHRCMRGIFLSDRTANVARRENGATGAEINDRAVGRGTEVKSPVIYGRQKLGLNLVLERERRDRATDVPAARAGRLGGRLLHGRALVTFL